jgi:hypothetical protein
MRVKDKDVNINFDVEIALKYTTKKDGISGNFATKAKTLTYVTPAMAKRITGIENFLMTANSAILNGTANSEIVNGLFVTIKKTEK